MAIEAILLGVLEAVLGGGGPAGALGAATQGITQSLGGGGGVGQALGDVVGSFTQGGDKSKVPLMGSKSKGKKERRGPDNITLQAPALNDASVPGTPQAPKPNGAPQAKAPQPQTDPGDMTFGSYLKREMDNHGFWT